MSGNRARNDEMRSRLRAWAGRYDALMHTDYEWPSDADEATWVTDGRVLLGLVRKELGLAYDVTYFDEGVPSERATDR